jgi:hypothetical protein
VEAPAFGCESGNTLHVKHNYANAGRRRDHSHSQPFEAAGVEFNGDQPDVRLTKAAAAHSSKSTGRPKPVIAAKVGRSKTAKATEKKKRWV